MIFRSLKMAGFKSFADTAEVDIEAGLTGIVGPNGCGKSNVVEGLRWVMGESSARQMRGTELDDIIFSGTDTRPQRNYAEIVLNLDNSERRAPSDFNDSDDLEILRRVERGKGTSYKINGKPARAKDVQLLFADTATGSRSAGIVSQGRIGAIVGAKPEDRRSLLEEAANIKGLHQRRHEAELRLKNAELNLERLDDIMAQLADQRQQLQRQARQASRYKSVADRIRKAEATLLLARWNQAQLAHQEADESVRAAKLQVAKAAETASASSRTRYEAAEKLTPLREAEVKEAAELQRLKLALGETERDETRLAEELQRLKQQLNQIETDRAREATLQEDADRSLTALADEVDTLTQLRETETPKLALADEALSKARETSKAADEAAAEAQTKWQSFTQSQQLAKSRSEALQARLKTAEDGLAAVNISELEQAAKTSAQAQQAADEAYEKLQQKLATSDTDLQNARTSRDAAYQAFQDMQNQLARLTAEADALSYLLAEQETDAGIPISDSLQVSDHMETALAACLADDLSLPLNSGERGYWRGDFTFSETPESPAIGTPLSTYVKGPKVLMRAISGVSVITDTSEAASTQSTLKPGQAFVNIEGSLWRWDGLVRQSNAGDAERIRQKQRLDELQMQKAQLETQAATSELKLEQAEDILAEAQQSVKSLQAEHVTAQSEVNRTQRDADKTQLALDAARLRYDDLTIARDNARSDLEDIDALGQSEDSGEMLEAEAEKLAQAAQAERAHLSDALQAEASLKQSLETAERRLKSIADQQNAWRTRQENTATRLVEMQTRQTQAEAELVRLEARPSELAEVKRTLLSQVETADAARTVAADALAAAETALNEAEIQQRNHEQALGGAREGQIRAEAVLERCGADIAMLIERISEKLEIAPAGLPEAAEVAADAELDPIDRLEERVSRLMRERESLGPVNLRADVEMEEIDTRITSMETEKQDLVEAIAKLRSAISTLNREGRARLLASFADVNKYFAELFTSLFGGGHAELRLTDSDDPLQAGLEILASPPGKRMQSLSLLSGGEQALTALAIIFAVFLTNPAPICVLDEVDAPLDDSNVARFCDLLRNIVSRTRTRFLVVTHHRMTMARMDRLFGVTMEQRGISRLVSVDLQTAESFRETRLI